MLFDLSGRWNKRASALATTALSAWLFIGAAPLFAQGAVTGTVTDSETLGAISGAQVFVAGTVVGTLSGAQGTYRLEGVPAGSQTITVRLIGYKELSQTVDVSNGQVVTADFSAEQTALRLQDIVVTGVVGATPQIKLPFTVERLNAADLPVPSSDVSSLLAGKAAGVSVISGSGQPGQSSAITLRGPTSINTSGRSLSPLIVIDGVIQSEGATLSDVNALDIDHIEIVKGAAAASLYGSRAQNGVIQISTKRGTGLATNSFDIMARGEYGFGQLSGEVGQMNSHAFLMNSAQTMFIDSDGNEVAFSDLGRVGFGSAVLANQLDPSMNGTTASAFANQPFPTALFDHVDQFFDPGETFDIYGAVTGRFGESSFRVSFDEFKEAGVVSCAQCIDNLDALNADRVGQGLSPFNVGTPTDEGYERQNARMNVDTRFGALDIAASGFYSRSVQDDKAVSNGAFSALTFASPAIDLTVLDPTDGYPDIDSDPSTLAANPLYNLATATEFNNRTRTMGSVDLNFSPSGLDWLTVEANASYDRTDFNYEGRRPKNERQAGEQPGTFTGGFLRQTNFQDEALNASLTLGASESFMDGDLTVRGKARYLVENQDFNFDSIFSSQFSVQDVPNFAATTGATTASNRIREIKAEGLFAIASVDYKGKYILDGLVRRDGSSLFGPEERWQTYYRGSAAWRLSQESFWGIDFIDEFKLRFSLGTAGGRPNFLAQYETFGVSAGAIFPINLGNTGLKPEYTTEREAGINLVLFNNLGLDLTYAWQNTDEQLLLVPQPAFVGFSNQWQNAGEISAETYEVSLRYAAIDDQDVGLNFRLNWDRTQQEITRLDVPDFTQGGNFFVSEGRPLGEMWGNVWASSCSDLAPIGVSAADCAANFQVNDDGLLVATGANNFTDGFSQGLWGTEIIVQSDAGDFINNFGIPVRVSDYSPACVRKNPTDFADNCVLQNFLPFGNTTPDWNASLATNLRYKSVALNVLGETSVGQSIYNGTAQWALRDQRGEDADQLGKSQELQKPVAYSAQLYDINADNSWFREDGDWFKLREISVGYTLPTATVDNLFGGAFDRITFNVIGRNLFTITNYRGYDPEVGRATGSLQNQQLNRVDQFGYPNFRTFAFSAELVF